MKVFLCSTYKDLVDERQAVLSAIGEVSLQHKSMEFFGAKPDRPIDACLAEVARSNVLVVVVGHKYGSLVPGRSISFSEAEYQEGHGLGKPCLVYMRDSAVPVLPKDFETDPENLRSLESLRGQLHERHTVASFRGPTDLAEAVASDLRETIELVEAEANRQEEAIERKSAFLAELERLVMSAVNEGLREALVLSAVRGALVDLKGRPPTLVERVIDAWGGLVSLFSRTSDGEQPWVFLSYAHSDMRSVQAVAKRLRRLRVRTWVDQQELVVGDSLVTEIQKGLDRASAFVFFASRASLESKWARHELDFFMSKRVSEGGGPPVIPVLLEDVELPALMRDILYVDMRATGPTDAARRIAAAVRGIPLDQLR